MTDSLQLPLDYAAGNTASRLSDPQVTGSSAAPLVNVLGSLIDHMEIADEEIVRAKAAVSEPELQACIHGIFRYAPHLDRQGAIFSRSPSGGGVGYVDDHRPWEPKGGT